MGKVNGSRDHLPGAARGRILAGACGMWLGLSGVVALGFSPTNYSSCVLWLQAKPAQVVTNAVGEVSQWTDASGRGHHAVQGDASCRAVFAGNRINGLPALRFDGADDHFTIAHHADLNAGEGLSIFFVCTHTNGFRLLQKGDGTGTDVDAWFLSPAPVMGVAGTWNAGVPYLSSWGIFEGLFEDHVGSYGRITTYTNGAATAFATNPVSAYAGNNDALYLGKRNNPTGTEGAFEGELAEVIIFTDDLDEAQRSQVGRYLGEKYGIATSYPLPQAYDGPAGVSNCVLWLAAEAGQVVTNASGLVSEWRDKTGRGHHALQGTTASQPRFVGSAIGGLPAVRFDGTNDYATIAHHADLDGFGGLTVFFVLDHGGVSNLSFRLMQKGTGYGATAADWFANPNAGLGVGGTWLNSVPFSNGPLLGHMVYDPTVLDSGALWSYTNGVACGGGKYLAQSYTGNTAPLVVGKRDSPSATEGYLQGDVAELIVFNRCLSAADQQAVGLYLQNRYGLAGSYSNFTERSFGPPWISQVAFSPASSGVYLGSPAILILTNGEYLVSYDLFGDGAPKNANGMYNASVTARSADRGLTWTAHTQATGFFWSSFFSLSNTIYRMGASARFEGIAIASSVDNGHTWTTPVTLVAGGNGTTAPNYTCGPVPVAIANGRVYRAMENMDPLLWAMGMRALVMSAPVGSDLLDPASWTKSNELPFDTAWLNGVSGIHTPSLYGYLEGNVVVAPNGEVWDILASNRLSSYDKAVILDVAADGSSVSFNRYIDFPGGGSKFTIRRDPVTGLYLSMGNNITDTGSTSQRNILSLSASSDLVKWTRVATLVSDDQAIPWAESVAKTGFQYADWQFEGDDIIYLVRTAYAGAASYHDSNRITFHRLENYVPLLVNRFAKGTVFTVK